MAIKDIRFETFLTSTDRLITMKRPLVYTNDINSAQLIFDVKDMAESDLSGASAEVLLYMRDGSFYQVTDVTRNGTEFSYVLKDNEGKHSGTAQAQLIVTVGQRELATPKFEFVIESGLDGKVATEVMIHDWTTLTSEAQRYIDDFVAAEADRQTTFETNESNRQQTFQANESARQTNENERISNEEARQALYHELLETGVLQTNINEKLQSLEEEYAPKLTEVTAQLAQTKQVFNESVSKVTEDSEVILARGEEETLGVRLDKADDRDAEQDERLDTAEQDINNNKLAVTRASKETKDLAATLSNVNVNQEAKQTLETNANIASLPVNAGNGALDATIKGFTATQLIKNGDFSDGTTGFAARPGSTITVNGSILEVRAVTDNPTAGAQRSFIQPIGSKVYIGTRYRAPAGTRLQLYDGQAGWSYSGSTGQWQINSGIGTITNNTIMRIYAPLLVGEVLELDYIQAINLTQIFGAGNEPTKEQCDIIFDNYFNGTKSFTPGRVRSTSPYEPYTETVQYVEPVKLNRLPNGVADEITADGDFIQRVGEHTLVEGDVIRVLPRTNYSQAHVLFDRLPSRTINAVPGIQGSFLVVNWTEIHFGIDGNYVPNLYATNLADGGRLDFNFPLNTTLAAARTALAGTRIYYQLEEPIVRKNVTTGNVIAHPKGTVYFEQYQADAGMYFGGLTTTNTSHAIKSLESLSVVDFMTGNEVELDVSKAVITGNSFTHPGLSDGDLVFLTYEFDAPGPNGNKSLKFYDSRYTIKDDVTGKFYKWSIKIVNGVPQITVEGV
ncbi:BppU family phage baseplate upper protein [Alkalibacterium thalassium]|uniref:BppU N-terminal domain-containing protein n=1 Tax=Alkalibacterium thalassium TaxID=426701 RepID=A0A1G8VNZ3_9LACT|nr:BppU family phage baseplate upper protein [Alkalibacterium thalassium]SDJ67693.1 protein of unknown function [Alkalibacterium thalassium]